MMMSRCRCSLIVGAGLCGCGVAILSGGLFEFKLPSAIECASPPIYRDFGPPAGCDNERLPHSRTGWMTSVAASTVTTTYAIFSFVLPAPTVAFTYKDAEDAAALYDRGVEVAKSTNVEPVTGEINLVHPTKDERLALIRSSNVSVAALSTSVSTST